MQKVTSIHFVGIKGVGMTPLALIAKEAGISVTGSDIGEEFITDVPLRKAGITPLVGFHPEHVGAVDLVITTGAHGGFDNLEVLAAKDRGIPVLTKGQAVGEYMKGELLGRSFTGISVSGTHGKTTTTALVATVLKAGDLDPSYIIGTSEVVSLGAAGHLGEGAHFIAEADEYATEPKHVRTPQFLWQQPHILVINNIEHDHPDIYPTLEDVKKAFASFVAHLEPDAIIIATGDDENVLEVIEQFSGKVLTFGFSPHNSIIITKIGYENARLTFSLSDETEYKLNVFGEYNALNATAAVLVAREVEMSAEEIQKGLLAFRGAKRRMEYVGELETGAAVFDDYAHNPRKVQKALEALRRAFPEKKLICIFQPHTYSRTKALLHEFAESFTSADRVILTPIYASLREEADKSISSDMLASEIKKHQPEVFCLANLSDVIEYIEEKRFQSDSIIVTMGAGDVYTLLEQLPFQTRNNDYTPE